MDTPRATTADAAVDHADWYRRAFDQAPIGIAIVAPDGRWLAANPAMVELLGVEPAETSDDLFHLTTHPDDIPADEGLAAEVLAGTRSSFSTEKRFRAADGTWHVGQSDVALVRDAAGEPLYFLCQLQDLSARDEAHAKLGRAEALQRASLDALEQGVVMVELGGPAVLANQAAERILGEPIEVLTRRWDDDGPWDDPQLADARGDALRPMDEAVRTGRAVQDHMVRWRRPDGALVDIRVSVEPVLDRDGTVTALVVAFTDSTERLAAERARAEAEDALRATTAWYAAVVAHSVDAICIVDEGGTITYASPTAGGSWEGLYELTSLTQVVERLHPDDRERLQADWARIIAAPERSHTLTGRMLMPSGDVRHIEVLATNRLDDPDVRGIVANIRDVTERAEASARLTWQAFHDPLTRLPNRSLLGDRLAHAIERSRRHDERVAILYIDLDRFKVVNDTMGHTAGDHLLVEVAGRILRSVRPDDTVARLGGDEFVVMTESVADPAAVVSMAERIGEEVRRPVIVPGGEVTVSASIGIAFDDGHEPDALLRDADIALYRAKERGRDRYEVFDESLRVASLRRLATERELRDGLEHDTLLVHFQPIVDTRSGVVLGCEALLRIPGPGGVLRSPNDHIEVADESGLIVPIGVLVLDEACAALGRWRADLGDRAPSHVTVNVTGRQLASPHLLPAVEKALGRHDLDPWNLVIELTESTIIGADRATVHTVMSLDDLGVGLAIDDFGTGYSSLAHLKRFPIQILKLDRAFVTGLGTDRSDTEIVRAVVSLGEALGLQVIAEGIETAAQMQALLDLGCHLGQGYLLGRPTGADGIGEQIDAVAHLIAADPPD